MAIIAIMVLGFTEKHRKSPDKETFLLSWFMNRNLVFHHKYAFSLPSGSI